MNDIDKQIRAGVRYLIIVPARCGSKGVPNKNIRILGDRPLLQWTSDAVAHAMPADALALLSTDSPEYAELGRRLGLAVPFLRPPHCSDDRASALVVIQHALNWFEGNYGYLPDYVMWLQPTSPFRTPSIIRQAVSMVEEDGVDAVIGCKAIYRDLTTLFRCDGGWMVALDRLHTTQVTRQQGQPLLTPNGAMYLCRTSLLLEHQSFYPERTLPLVMNAVQSLDIDTEEDWAIAEAFIHQGLVDVH